MPAENLVQALIKAQSEFPPLERDRTVTVKTRSGTYSYDYMTLGSQLSLCQPVLARNGLAVSQLVISSEDGSRVGVRTVLMHQSGEQIESTVFMPLLMEGNYLQEAGKIITYLRRYAYAAILGIHSETDDDGSGVGGTSPSQPATKSAPEKKAAADRPYSPEKLIAKLDVTKAAVTPASKSQMGLVAGMLKRYCEGDEDLRHKLQVELTGGFASLSDADPKMVHAILRWLDPKQDSGGDYYLPEVVKKELDEIVKAMPEQPDF